VSRIAIVVFAVAVLVSATEALYWARLGLPDERLPLVLATLTVALVAALAASLASFFLRSSRAMALGIAIAWTPLALDLHGRYGKRGLLAALVLTTAMAALTVLTARSRRGLVALGSLTALSVLMAITPKPSTPLTSSTLDAPDIVLLVMDTTRRDRLSVYGYDQATSPNLETFATKAQVYEDAWSVAPWTPPSHASMFTGLLPAEHGVDGQMAPPFPTGIATLPSILSDAGYRTAGFPGNANLMAPGWDRGFDVYLPADFEKNHSLIRLLNRVLLLAREPSHHARGARLFARAKTWWTSETDAPRFAFINLVEPHTPYLPHAELYDRFLPGIDREEAFAIAGRRLPDGSAAPPWTAREKEIVGKLYDAEIAGMDREIGCFLDWLAARGELDDTLFVITADHGERLGERGLFGHALVMDPYLLRVPLLVRYPARLAAAPMRKRVRLDGLPGYILYVAGIRAPEAMAKRALHLQDTRFAIAQHRPPASLVDDMLDADPRFDSERFREDWFWVASDRFALEWPAGEGADGILTDLAADPNFSQDVGEDHAAAAAVLRAVAQGLPRYGSTERLDPDPELLEKLKALGYIHR